MKALSRQEVPFWGRRPPRLPVPMSANPPLNRPSEGPVSGDALKSAFDPKRTLTPPDPGPTLHW